MMQLGKTIREGLGRQAAAPQVQHPDADLLTSFLEQTLPQAERQQVMRHLSLCGDCREVVALALPEMEVSPVAVAQPEASGWTSSPWTSWIGLRWAATAAAVLLIAGTVTVYRSGNQPSGIAKIVDGPDAVANLKVRQAEASAEKRSLPTAPLAAQNEGAAPQNTVARAQKDRSAESKPAEAAPLMASAVQPPSPVNAVETKSKKTADEARSDQLGATMAKATQPPLVPPSAEALSQPNLSSSAKVAQLERPVAVAGAMPAATGNANPFPSGSGRALRESNEPVLQTYNQPEGVFTVQTNQPRSNVTFRGRESAALMRQREPMGVGMFSNPPMPNAPSLNRRWQVTSDGQLKRSHAIGEDFHPVHVADGIFFKSVAESGSEVWAGGVGGALYHSTDDGKSWMKLMPSAGDQALIADVTAIRATGRGAAELDTSNAERWITIDGGQHWRKTTN